MELSCQRDLSKKSNLFWISSERITMKPSTLVVASALLMTMIVLGEATPSIQADLRDQLRDLQKRHVDWLLDHPDVTAVDINHKTVGGERTDQLSLVIWVNKKLPEEEVPHERRLPREIEGFQTDVIEAPGRMKFLQGDIDLEEIAEVQEENCTCPTLQEFLGVFEGRISEPPLIPIEDDCPCQATKLLGGDCIAMKGGSSAGTLGYFTLSNGNFGILSAYHVTGPPVIGPPVNRITDDSGNYIATVFNGAYTPKVDLTNYRGETFVDASHSPLCKEPHPLPKLIDGTVVPGIHRRAEVKCGDPVRFCGCKSRCTKGGEIHSIDWCGVLDGRDRICNQILFSPPGSPGDSGSLLINADTKRAVGLVVAAYIDEFDTPVLGVANPIQTVLSNLGATLAVVV